MKNLLLLFITCTLFLSCAKDDYYELVPQIDKDLANLLASRSPTGSKNYYILPNSDDYVNIPQDPNNPITTAKVILGGMLFHETGLAKDAKHDQGIDTYSCASCHHSKAGFQSCKRQGIGDGGIGFGATGEQRQRSPDYLITDLDVQPIKSPSILNTAYQKLMLWNGQFGATDLNTGTQSQWTPGTPKETNYLGYEGVETQAIAGLTVHRLRIDEETITNLGYKPFFDTAFPNVSLDRRYSTEYAGLAIAAYERTVLANKAPFQLWLKGDINAMSIDEKKGAILFFGKGKCFECHSSPALSSMKFSALGMKDLSGIDILGNPVDDNTKKGRGGFTGLSEDNYKFKVPQLYSIKSNGFYGHGSSFTSIKDIIIYKNKAIKENINVPNTSLDPLFVPLQLSSEEINNIVLFIENSLNDASLDRFVPSVLSNNCIPNNDYESQQDICN